MFFYISFLKPPPVQSLIHGNILITPQIANDLRTELFDGSENLFISWHLTRDIATLSTPSSQLISTKPMKLTTWRTATAYKEIPVPLPPGVREGQAWYLTLSTQPVESPVIDLCDAALGSVTFPVMSMPIQFLSKIAKNSAHTKQEKIERLYRLRLKTEESAEVSLRITEQTSFDLDKKVWDSGIGLSSWLVDLERSIDINGPLAEVKNALFSTEPRNVLELGGGIGIVGLCLAALWSTDNKRIAEDVRDSVVITDLESAMPLIECNINANAIHLRGTRLETRVLDWDDLYLPAFVQDFPDGFDAIIMADVAYNTASFHSLISTILKLIRLGHKPPIVLLGYKERDDEERILWGLLRKAGLNFQKVGQRVGAGGHPVEVWLGIASVETLGFRFF